MSHVHVADRAARGSVVGRHRGIVVDGVAGRGVQRLAYGLEQCAKCARRLAGVMLLSGFAQQLPQMLAVGGGVSFQQFGQRRVAFGQQPCAPGFGLVQARSVPTGGFAAGAQGVVDGIQTFAVLVAQQLGDVGQLAFACAMRRDPLEFGQMRQQRCRRLRLLQRRLAQLAQPLRQRQYIQRLPAALATAGAEESSGLLVAPAHHSP